MSDTISLVKWNTSVFFFLQKLFTSFSAHSPTISAWGPVIRSLGGHLLLDLVSYFSLFFAGKVFFQVVGCRACEVLWKGSKSVLRMYLCYRFACRFCFLCGPRLFPPWYGGWGRQITISHNTNIRALGSACHSFYSCSLGFAPRGLEQGIKFRIGFSDYMEKWCHSHMVHSLPHLLLSHGPLFPAQQFFDWSSETRSWQRLAFWCKLALAANRLVLSCRPCSESTEELKNTCIEGRQQPTLSTTNYISSGFLIYRSHCLYSLSENRITVKKNAIRGEDEQRGIRTQADTSRLIPQTL